MTTNRDIKKITTKVLQEMKFAGEKIAMLTCYDFTMAKILDQANIELLLVGDSASNVIAGHNSTLPITLDQMIYHTQSVCRGTNRAMVVADLPFGSYQTNAELAMESAIRIMKETGAHAIKMEGGAVLFETIQKLTQAGIPVMGHLGLTPQSIHQIGSYSVQAREEKEGNLLIENALLLEQAGCFGIVLEKIPANLATKTSQLLKIPTIGIGAGNGCDGQVLVIHDMLGLTQDFKPKFVRKYANLGEKIREAALSYIDDVKSGTFPNENESY